MPVLELRRAARVHHLLNSEIAFDVCCGFVVVYACIIEVYTHVDETVYRNVQTMHFTARSV